MGSDRMADERDDRERQRPQSSEGVRIIGAEEAAAAIEAGHVAGRRPDDAPRFGDVPERPRGPSPDYRFPLPEAVDPSEVPRPPVSSDMPHWTEPPTGEVPKVLAEYDDEDDDDLGADPEPAPARGPRPVAPVPDQPQQPTRIRSRAPQPPADYAPRGPGGRD